VSKCRWGRGSNDLQQPREGGFIESLEHYAVAPHLAGVSLPITRINRDLNMSCQTGEMAITMEAVLALIV
jgi:hypothetical protein